MKSWTDLVDIQIPLPADGVQTDCRSTGTASWSAKNPPDGGVLPQWVVLDDTILTRATAALRGGLGSFGSAPPDIAQSLDSLSESLERISSEAQCVQAGGCLLAAARSVIKAIFIQFNVDVKYQSTSPPLKYSQQGDCYLHLSPKNEQDRRLETTTALEFKSPAVLANKFQNIPEQLPSRPGGSFEGLGAICIKVSVIMLFTSH